MKWKADQFEAQITRNPFPVVLVDGDGYYFKQAFLKTASSGGALASHQLFREVQDYVNINGPKQPTDL